MLYHLLEHKSELFFGDAHSSNLIVQGNNLRALKALLLHYATLAILALSIQIAKAIGLLMIYFRAKHYQQQLLMIITDYFINCHKEQTLEDDKHIGELWTCLSNRVVAIKLIMIINYS